MDADHERDLLTTALTIRAPLNWRHLTGKIARTLQEQDAAFVDERTGKIVYKNREIVHKVAPFLAVENEPATSDPRAGIYEALGWREPVVTDEHKRVQERFNMAFGMRSNPWSTEE